MPKAKLIDANTFECTRCHRPHLLKELWLSDDYSPICTDCYLDAIPEIDIDEALYGIEKASGKS